MKAIRKYNWYVNGSDSHVNVHYTDGTQFGRRVSHKDAMRLCNEGEAAVPYLVEKYSITNNWSSES